MKFSNLHFRFFYPSALALTTLLTVGLSGCKSDTVATITTPDPAMANLAPVSASQPSAGQPTRVLGQTENYQPQQQDENYDNQGQGYSDGQNQYSYESNQAPPPLQVSQQPPSPGRNYIWTPGYWGYSGGRYVWINGAWTAPPYAGALWTPPYWGRQGNNYRLHQGYWGRHVGYYGGIDYGSGYVGTGYYGGYWSGNNFYYNRSVNHLSANLPYLYDRPVELSGRRYGSDPLVRISFNGIGGVVYAPRNYEVVAMREQHVPAVAIRVEGIRPAIVQQNVYVERQQPVYVERHDNGWHGHKNDDKHDNGHDEGRGKGHEKHGKD